MASTPAIQLGDVAAQPTQQEDQQVPIGTSTTINNVADPQHAQSLTQPQDVQQPPPSEPRLSGEESSARRVPPPITIPPAAITRQDDTEGIGPSTELPTPMIRPSTAALAQGPVIQFTLLLASTGTRHPYQINERYLSKRNVRATRADGQFDPSTISVYTLKELILKDWRDDWDTKPFSPSAIRLIFFGQLLADKSSLKDCKLHLDGTTNVIHVTVKPQEIMDEEEAAGKGGKHSFSRDRDGADRTPGCRCVIL